MNKRNAQLCLCHLHFIVKEISEIVQALVSTSSLPETLYNSITKYTLIRTCAFYDELEKHVIVEFSSSDMRYETLKKIVDFIVSERDKYFPDIRRIRNNGLAHHYRIRNEGWRSIFEKETSYTFPKYSPELVLNFKLIDTALSAIKVLYPEIVEILHNDLCYPIEENTGVVDTNYDRFIKEVEAEVERLLRKM